jgi:collagenase-like PrtC family protease
MGTPVGAGQLAEYVRRLQRHGIAFNYLLNASCLGNREWTRPWQRKLTRFLEQLQRIGVTRLTVSTPFLLERVKASFPDFQLKVGIFAQVDTPERARFWEDLGADAVTLESFSVNRDFPRLEAIRRAVACDLQLIVNHACLPNCPMQPYHQNGFAHSSDGSGGVFIDYCFLRCTQRRLADPALFVRAGWIRPEDLATYERIGFDTFKLLERGIPSSELLKRVRAYAGRRFDGNLAELFLSYGFKEPLRKPRFWTLRHFFRPRQVRPWKLKPLLDLVRQQGMMFPSAQAPIVIDAAGIPADFIDRFRNGSEDVDAYCRRVAERAVHIDPDYRREALAGFARVQRDLATGGLWNA